MNAQGDRPPAIFMDLSPLQGVAEKRGRDLRGHVSQPGDAASVQQAGWGIINRIKSRRGPYTVRWKPNFLTKRSMLVPTNRPK